MKGSTPFAAAGRPFHAASCTGIFPAGPGRTWPPRADGRRLAEVRRCAGKCRFHRGRAMRHRRSTSLARSLTIAAAALLSAVLLAPRANAGPPAIQQPFAADSGDSCRHGFTAGTLTWDPGIAAPGGQPTVSVDGYLADDIGPCPPDIYYSTATFTAYSGTAVVDTEVRKADNERVAISFTFVDRSASPLPRLIDRVVIQVCRHTTLSPPDYCGKAQEYKHP